MQRLAGFCRHQCRLFFTALQFFTRLPIPRWVGFDADWLPRAMRYFPLVGAVVGLIAAAAYALAAWLWPAPLAALLATIAGIWVTGALHEDGFADVCDGFGGGQSGPRTLEIMQDSRIGAYGAIGVGALLAAKVFALSLLPPATAIAALLFAHPLSRLAAVALTRTLDYARADGKAGTITRGLSGAELATAALTAALPALLLGAGGALAWPPIVLGALLGAAATGWMGQRFRARIGGYTGDCLGAAQQVAEVVLYLSVLAGLGHGAWR